MNPTNHIFNTFTPTNNNNNISFINNNNNFNIIDNSTAFFDLFILNDENYDDNASINDHINTWRKLYFEFLEQEINDDNKDI
jgi:hypothetical protein